MKRQGLPERSPTSIDATDGKIRRYNYDLKSGAYDLITYVDPIGWDSWVEAGFATNVPLQEIDRRLISLVWDAKAQHYDSFMPYWTVHVMRAAMDWSFSDGPADSDGRIIGIVQPSWESPSQCLRKFPAALVQAVRRAVDDLEFRDALVAVSISKQVTAFINAQYPEQP